MSKLWSSFLEQIRILGNHSGCHQMPERSFFIHGKQFPVCARCTGATVGELFAILLAFRKKYIRPKTALFFMSVMGADWLLQEVKIKESTNLRRFITGFFGGFGIFSVYFILLGRLLHALGVCFGSALRPPCSR